MAVSDVRVWKAPPAKARAVTVCKERGGRKLKHHVPAAVGLYTTLLGSLRTYGYPFRAPTKGWCTPAACRSMRNPASGHADPRP